MARVAPEKSETWSICYRDAGSGAVECCINSRQEKSSPVADLSLLDGHDVNNNRNSGEEMGGLTRANSAFLSSTAETALIKAHQGRSSERMNE